MTVKSKRGRYRYVAFKVPQELTKPALIARMKAVCRPGCSPYVIQAGEGMAVIRCAPSERDGVIGAMAMAESGSEPVRTSGTLRTLRDAYPVLIQAKKK